MAILKPIISQKFLPNILWRIPDEKVYLTLDDGPDPVLTPKLLALLHKYEAKVTFFLIGQKAQRHPNIVRQIKEAGHAIGNHSFSHTGMLWKSQEWLRFELNKTDDILGEITGEKPTLFRPPHGLLGIKLLQVVKSAGHKIVLWSASVQDYKAHANAHKIEFQLQKKIGPGRIILLHDGHPNSINTFKALEDSLEAFRNQGMQFSGIPENI